MTKALFTRNVGGQRQNLSTEVVQITFTDADIGNAKLEGYIVNR